MYFYLNVCVCVYMCVCVCAWWLCTHSLTQSPGGTWLTVPTHLYQPRLLGLRKPEAPRKHTCSNCRQTHINTAYMRIGNIKNRRYSITVEKGRLNKCSNTNIAIKFEISQANYTLKVGEHIILLLRVDTIFLINSHWLFDVIFFFFLRITVCRMYWFQPYRLA